jgi:hypothetical protein
VRVPCGGSGAVTSRVLCDSCLRELLGIARAALAVLGDPRSTAAERHVAADELLDAGRWLGFPTTALEQRT